MVADFCKPSPFNLSQDASEAFWTYHSEKVLQKTAAEYKIGEGEFNICIAYLSARYTNSLIPFQFPLSVKPGSKL